MAKVVFILGAGCSKSAGAPLMMEFFDVADRLLARGATGNATSHFKKVAEARSKLQQVHSKCELDLSNLETVFTALELAKTLGRLPGYEAEAEIDAVLESLKIVIDATLELSIKYPHEAGSYRVPKPHADFAAMVKTLRTMNPPNTCAVITFNYDMLLDSAFMMDDIPFGYSLATDQAHFLPYLKLHGSLNWFQRQDGAGIEVVPLNAVLNNRRPFPSKEKAIPFPIREAASGIIAKKGIAFVPGPVIVPPTWTKGDHQRNLSSVWRRAALELKDAEHIVIAGYSLPETDLFFRHLYGLGTVGDTLIKGFHVFDPEPRTEERFKSMLGSGAKSRFFFHGLKFESAVSKMKSELISQL